MNRKLTNVVAKIVQNSDGIRHVELVQEVLGMGYSYEGKEGISAHIHSILRNLIAKGEITRNQNDLDRKYKPTSGKRTLAPTG